MILPPAVILAAGESSRFWPLSTHGHKSLHRLCGKAIIEHTVESLVTAGITELVIVQSPISRHEIFPHRTIEDQLGDGSRYGATIRYVEQPEPLGQRDAILRAATTGLEGDFLIINPENLNAGELARELVEAKGDAAGAVAAQRRDDTWLFGVFSETDGKLDGLVEKPPRGEEPSQLCNMSVQLLGQDYLALLKNEPPDRPAANLSALLRLAGSAEVRIHVTDLPFFPLKYPWNLFAMAGHLKPVDGPYLDPAARVDDAVTVDADCVIEADAVVTGPAVLTASLVGAGSRVDGTDLPHSILGADVRIGPEAVIGHQAGAGQTVRSEVKGDAVDSGQRDLGVVVGQGARIDRGTHIAAGTMIGAYAHVGSGRPTSGTVADRGVSGVEPGVSK